MSQQDVEVVRANYEAFWRRDLEEFLSYMDPEVEFKSLVLEVEGAYHGHEGIRAWWDNVLAVFPEWRPQFGGAREVAGCVLVRVQAEGSGTGSGIAVERSIWQVADVRGGRVKLSAFFRTEAEALQALACQ
jgi:ketosteroid isomerase-like protein